MPSPRLYILPWNQPPVYAVTERLARGWTGEGPLDLSDTLVVVPTAQAGRRLREALAAYAAGKGQAVFPPRVRMPDQLTSPEIPAAWAPPAASRAELLLAWIETLRSADLSKVREVFPLDPPARDFAWALRLAREFARLQAGLAENGLRMADVAGRAGEDFPEAARWRRLGELEAACDAALATRGLRDPQAVKIAFAAAPTPPAGVRCIVVAGTPDPLPLAVRALSAHAESGVPVEVLVAGPADEAESRALFDEWGRPSPPAWASRAFSPPDFERRVRLCADPAAQADVVVSCAVGYGRPGGLLAAGVADPDVLPSLENGLARAGVPAFNPEGRPLRGGALHALLSMLAELAGGEPSFASIAALLRCPDVLAWLGGPSDTMLAELDDLHAKHLPPTLAAARAQVKHPALSRALEEVVKLRARLLSEVFPDNVRAVLTEIFHDRRFEPARPGDARTIEAANAWAAVLAEMAAALNHFPGLAAADVWELALRALGDSPRFDEKPDGAVELQGWLELLWEDAPHLVVAGLNDGRVPDAVVGDAFLPEGLRERLGLKTNAARFARDAYLLHALAACRGADRGRLDLLVGKVSAAGDPLRPSRLLLQCADADLPTRVAFLFGHAEAERPNPAWRRAWKLTPRADAPIERISVTAFRDYLKCPFRFYLKHGLRMQAVDPHKTELDAMDFGTLCHAALEAMGRADSPVRDSTDAVVLRDFLLAELDRAARRSHGEHPSLPLVVQLESARQRLAKLAEVQARERAEGWVIEHVEKTINFDLGGLPVRGKIDRIDRHERTGAVRVIDYKTSDKPVNPAVAHVRKPRRAEDLGALPEFARFGWGGEEAIWADLQLPLYLEALAGEFGHALACGYFNLPKAAGETGVQLWADYDPGMQEAAMRCARGVAAAVRARRFWPPAELPAADSDDFAGLFHAGADASVEWAGKADA